MPQNGVLHVGEMVQPGQALPLGQGKAADVVGRPVQVIQLLPGQLLAGRVDFCPGHPQRGAGAAVKAGAVLRQGGVPPGSDVPDNPGYAAAALLRLSGGRGAAFFKNSIGKLLLFLDGPKYKAFSMGQVNPQFFMLFTIFLTVL